jgi:hypothetical protein
MKTRLLTVTAILILSVTAVQAQVTFGVVAGPNFQNLAGKDHNGDKIDNGLIVSFHAGAKVNIPVAPDFYFQTCLLYSGKGSRNNFIMPAKSADNELHAHTRLSYIELPLNLLFRPQFSNGHILLGFGPYVAYAVAGKQDYEYGDFSLNQTVKFRNKITSSEAGDISYAYYRPFDAGANIFAGYEFDMGLFFHLNAQLGLLKLNPEITDVENDEASFKNTGFGLSAGFNF